MGAAPIQIVVLGDLHESETQLGKRILEQALAEKDERLEQLARRFLR